MELNTVSVKLRYSKNFKLNQVSFILYTKSNTYFNIKMINIATILYKFA